MSWYWVLHFLIVMLGACWVWWCLPLCLSNKICKAIVYAVYIRSCSGDSMTLGVMTLRIIGSNVTQNDTQNTHWVSYYWLLHFLLLRWVYAEFFIVMLSVHTECRGVYLLACVIKTFKPSLTQFMLEAAVAIPWHSV